MTTARRLAPALTITLILVALAVALTVAPSRVPATALQAAGARPNIVFILTDDQDLLLSSMDFMPQTRALLGQQGMTFNEDFVPLSLCCPSRATILTGLYPHNHKIYTNHSPAGGFARFAARGLEQTTVATALHTVGYRTALFGKYLNGYPEDAAPTHIPPGWDEWASPSSGDAYDNFNYTLNENGKLVQHGSSPPDYLTDVIAAKATDFIRNSAAKRQPFFLYFATYAPHVPATPAPRHADLFPDIKAPRTPSFNESDVSDKPERIRRLPLLPPQRIASIDGLYRRRLQSLQAVDEAVAAIVKTLDATSQLANTYVIFTSDNGFHMGQHRLKPGKYTPYEPDIHMPLLVRGPGVAAGSSTSAATMSVDFAPTLAEFAGARLQMQVDGRSLVSLLHGQTPAGWRQFVFLEQFNFNASDNPSGSVLEPPDPQDGGVIAYPAHLGLRTPDFKYVERRSGNREVYDLRQDPDELNNLALRVDPAWLAKMSGIAHRVGACSGESCRQLDGQPLPSLPVLQR